MLFFNFSTDDIEVSTISFPPYLSNTVPNIQSQEFMTDGTVINEKIAEVTPEPTSTPLPSTPPQKVKHDYNIIIIGDSRMVGMELTVPANATFIAKGSQGLKWLKEEASYIIERTMNEDSILVFNLGINDLGNANNYVSYLNSFKEQYPDIEMYFLSVNPVDEYIESQHGYSVRNTSIEEFNQKMRNSLVGFTYLDSYSNLIDSGISTFDGVHYNKSTYQYIYDFILASII